MHGADRILVLRASLESLLKFAESSSSSSSLESSSLVSGVSSLLSDCFDVFYPTWSERMHRISLLIGDKQARAAKGLPPPLLLDLLCEKYRQHAMGLAPCETMS